jgi:hypothetical protein
MQTEIIEKRNRLPFKDVKPNLLKVIDNISAGKVKFEFLDREVIGFYICSIFKEEGRKFFHLAIENSGGYDKLDANLKYDNWLKDPNNSKKIFKDAYFPGVAKILKNYEIDVNDFGFSFEFKTDPVEEVKAIKAPEKIISEVKKIKEEKVSNFAKVEGYLKSLYDLRYNEVSNELEYKAKDEILYKAINEYNLYRMLQHNNISFSFANLSALLRSDFVQVYNPLQEYFEGLPEWNLEGDNDYIEQLTLFVKAKDPARFKIHFKKMLVRTIACALMDSVFNKQAFILVHDKQNSGKSTFCRWLCPQTLKSYYTENISIDKDSLISLSENFIINLDELSTLQKTELNALKSVFSKLTIKVRRPYDKKASLSPRRASFLGSTNKTEFLTDETGSVRWLCFEIDGIDWSYSKTLEIDKVWAQAYALYKSGFKYELTAAEIDENEEKNRHYQIVTQEMELIQKHYTPGSKEKHNAFFTASDFEHGLKEKYFGIRLSINNIGKALKMLGFIKDQKYNGVYQVKGYYINITSQNLMIE